MLNYQRVNVKNPCDLNALSLSLWPRNLLPKHHTYQESSASEIETSQASAPKHPTSSRDDGELLRSQRIDVDQSFRKPRAQRFLHEHQNRIYIYLENHDNIFCHGFGHFFCQLRFFPNTAMSGCKPSTYRTIGFLNSWICRTGSDSISVSSRDSIWGSMLTFDYCFFSTWCWKNTGILWVHPNLVGNMAVFVARFGRPWVPDHDSQFAPLRTEIPLLETVGGCPNPVLSKDLNNPSQSKTKIRNWTKKHVRCW